MAATTTTTKRCPGVVSLGREPHEEPATSEFFASNASNADHLSTRCKVCSGAYGKAWSAAKKAGNTFSAKLGGGQAGTTAPEERAPGVAQAAAEAERHTAARKPRASAIEEHLNRPRARKGWTTEVVAGTEYPMPEDGAVGTPEGQAALEVLNRARDAERRRRNTEAKRMQRARAKAASAELADGPRA